MRIRPAYRRGRLVNTMATETATAATVPKWHIHRRLYDWVLHWADTPYGAWALFLLAFAESSFFPIPPDVLLIALCVSVKSKSFRYALICSIGSILGGLVGFGIGKVAMDTLGQWIINSYSLHEQYETVVTLYQRNAFLYILLAAFTPIPYKVFTIAAGACNVPVFTLVAASTVGRPGRFFLVAVIFYWVGPSARKLIEKYFNLATLLFAALLVIGFLAIKYLI